MTCPASYGQRWMDVVHRIGGVNVSRLSRSYSRLSIGGDRLRIALCIPRSWREYEIDYRYSTTLYRIQVENPNGVSVGVVELDLDGKLVMSAEITRADDGKTHGVRVVLGEGIASPEHETLEDVLV